MSLQKLRSEVDRLDRKLTQLLNRRTRLARQIGAFKARNGQRIFDAERERSLLQDLARRNKGPLQGSELRNIYRVILRTSRKHQRNQRKARRR